LDILKDDLLFSLGMREYCVGRDIATGRLVKNDLTVGLALQEAYQRHEWTFASDLMASTTRVTPSVYLRNHYDLRVDKM
jgi:hypothetical protein